MAASKLRLLTPPGLTLDTYEDWGFLTIAMVETRNLRPRFAPKFIGRDFFQPAKGITVGEALFDHLPAFANSIICYI